MNTMKIGMKMTKAVEKTFTPQEMHDLVEGSINHCILHPQPDPEKGTTLHYMTKAGELVAYVFLKEEKWRCYFAFANESTIPEEFPNEQRAGGTSQEQVPGDS